MERTEAIKLLAIDDKPDNLTTLSAVMRDVIPQTRVLAATNGPAGIELAVAEDPDVILLDIVMPGMDGFEVCRRLKADERIKDIPVLFLTALKADAASRVKALEAGAEGFLAKPLETAELTAQIRAMIKVKAAHRSRRTEKERLEALVAERMRDLKESKALVDAIVENAPLMIFLKEAQDLRFVVVNRAGEDLLGYDSKDLLGKNDLDLFSPDQAAFFMAKDREVLATGDAVDIPEEPIQTAKKGERLLHTRKVCLKGADGVTKYLLGISEDITARKRAESELKQSFQSLRDSLAGLIKAMSAVVESRDPYTAGHQKRVAGLAQAIALEMSLPTHQIEGLQMAATIHDLGKIVVPAEILSKPTKLSKLEYGMIKTHSQAGCNILKDIDFPWPIARIILEHHEKMDGSGYPQGLAGEKTLLESRIITVADVVEAMASHRPYRPALGIDAALEEIEKNKGLLYDADVVAACLALFREKGFRFEVNPDT